MEEPSKNNVNASAAVDEGDDNDNNGKNKNLNYGPLSPAAPVAPVAINPFDTIHSSTVGGDPSPLRQSAAESLYIKNLFDLMSHEADGIINDDDDDDGGPIEFGGDDNVGFIELVGERRHQESASSGQNDDDVCNEQQQQDQSDEKEEGQRVTESTIGSVWDENDGNIDNINSAEDDNNSNNNATENNSSNNSNTGKLLGSSCIQLLHKLIIRICRPHIRSPLRCCCLNSSSQSSQQQHSLLLPPCLTNISPRKRQIICRSLIIIFMIITITFTLLDLIFLKRYLHSWLQKLLAFLLDHPAGGGVLFVGIFLIASLCFFPVPLLSLGAGYVYIELYGLGIGICVAFLVCYIGYLVGAAVCFARSRYLMRRLIVRFSEKYPVVRAVDRAFETMGFRIFLLLRLSPAMPFNAMNYIGGITAIKFRAYWMATCVGIVPGLIWTIIVGATFGTVGSRGVDGNQQMDDKSAVNKYIVLGLGIGLGVLGLIGTAIYARKELAKIVLAEQQAREREEQEARLVYSNDELDAENPQSGYDDESLPVPFEESPYALSPSSHSLARSRRRGSQGSLHSMMSGNSESSTPSQTGSPITPVMSPPCGQRRNWTEEDVMAELPIVPVFSPIFRKMLSLDGEGISGTHDESVLNTGTHPGGLGDIDESRALSFRNQQSMADGFIPNATSNVQPPSEAHGQEFYFPRANRRRCGTDPYDRPSMNVAAESLQYVNTLNEAVDSEGMTADLETTPKKGLMKMFQGYDVNFPRFNSPRFIRRRSVSDFERRNTDPGESEKSDADLDLEVGQRQSQHRASTPSPNRIVDVLMPRITRSASMSHLELDTSNSNTLGDLGEDDEEVDREWFWLFA